MSVKDYDLNPDNNTQINGINIAEGCPPSGINNAIRQLMADVKADKDAQDKATVKTVNGNAPDAAGNITPEQTGCLTLTGGTMTGAILFNRNDAYIRYVTDTVYNYKYINIVSSGWSTGSKIQLFTDDSPNATSEITLTAGDKYLSLKPDGTLSWCGVDVLNPVGTVIAYAANSVPGGYLLCNGAAVSRTTYAKLFAVIGGTYGSGDGSTTFNLPNLIGRYIEGEVTAGIYNQAGLPNIEGALNNTVYTAGDSRAKGAFYSFDALPGIAASGPGVIGPWHVGFSAQRFNSIYGNSTTVQPPAVTMRYCIKY